MKKRRYILWAAALLMLAILSAVALDQRIVVRRYTVETEKVTAPVRLVVLADFHDGANLDSVLSATIAQNPDAVLMVGDMLPDGGDCTRTWTLMRELAARYPCYYVTGNHEQAIYETEKLMEAVRATGVQPAEMQSIPLTVRGQTLTICGAPNQVPKLNGKYLKHAQTAQLLVDQAPEGSFTVLMAHQHERAEKYAQGKPDLLVSGHSHGGQVRIPGLINGLCDPGWGWFPAYAGGLYHIGDTTFIVSRGLSTQLQWYVPRIFNRPEVVVVDVIPGNLAEKGRNN